MVRCRNHKLSEFEVSLVRVILADYFRSYDADARRNPRHSAWQAENIYQLLQRAESVTLRIPVNRS